MYWMPVWLCTAVWSCLLAQYDISLAAVGAEEGLAWAGRLWMTEKANSVGTEHFVGHTLVAYYRALPRERE